MVSPIGRDEALVLARAAAKKRMAAPSADLDVGTWYVISDDLAEVTRGHVYMVLQEPA